MIGGRGSVNYDLFGIGNGAGAAGICVPINQKGSLFLGQFLYRMGGWHLGPRYQVRQSTIRPELAGDSFPPGIEIPEAVLDSKTAAMGPQVMRDRRDSLFYSIHSVVIPIAPSPGLQPPFPTGRGAGGEG